MTDRAWAPPSTAPTIARIESVDIVRGLVMAVMLLDHTRDFVHREGMTGDPLDLTTTTTPLFLTRWITHFCAPVFVFLAGTSARLRALRGSAPRALARHLAARGAFLIALELLVVRPLIWMNVDPAVLAFLQVIWAIGVSMLVLAALVRLRVATIAVIGIAIVVGHNLLDGIRVDSWHGPGTPRPGLLAVAWMLLHQRGGVPVNAAATMFVEVGYPLLPWLGVMLCGYGFGELYAKDTARRRRVMVAIGSAAVLAFVALRWSNLYGDPRPWSPQSDVATTFLSFLNVEKYPPSLLFVLMTIGPAILALAWLDGRRSSRRARPLLVLGSVPLFFYVLQWPTVHGVAWLFQWIDGQPVGWETSFVWTLPRPLPAGWGFSLGMVYLAWAIGLVALYPLCAWYAGVRRRRRDLRWLSFL